MTQGSRFRVIGLLIGRLIGAGRIRRGPNL
jgi:hypothetical protein